MTEDRLAQIRARLAAATPGPWEHMAYDSGHSRFEMQRTVVTPDTGDMVCDMDGLSRSKNERHAKDDGGADAEFIANAPADVAFLLAEVDKAAAMLADPDGVIDEAQAEAWDEGRRLGLMQADWEFGVLVNMPDLANPYRPKEETNDGRA